MMSDHAMLDLVKNLIARPSVTPEDKACQQQIIDRLAPLGFKAEIFEQGGVTNVWLRRGAARPLVVLAGHTDVVPTGPLDQWQSNPFEPAIREGRLYGRGAADMKSSLAGFTIAIEEFVQQNPDHSGSIALLLTSDEEGPAVHGTVIVCNALKARNEALDYCIVGEPTSSKKIGDTIKNGRRGSLSAKLTIVGKQGHVAYPQLAKNPVHLFAPALAVLTQTTWDNGNEYFPPTTMQVSNYHSGAGASNVVPGQAVIDFNFRFSTASTPESLKQRVVDILEAHNVPYRIEWLLSGSPFLTPRGELSEALAGAIKDETGLTTELSTTGGTSDGRFIASICPQVIEFGPCNESIHQVNENIVVNDLNPLKNIYRRVLERLLPNA
jgi:succinyl-diaminopimelate desuccinylase